MDVNNNNLLYLEVKKCIRLIYNKEERGNELLTMCNNYIVSSTKLGTRNVDRFLSLADSNFVDDVSDDLKCFLADKKNDRVLVFPPVSNYRRFLIHKCVEDLALPDITTFSIGQSDERRTVVCYKEQLLSDVACARPNMGLSQPDHDTFHATLLDSASGPAARAHRSDRPQEKIRSAPTKPRRPDRAVYVPRALRAEQPPEPKPPDVRKAVQPPENTTKCPKSPVPREKSQPTTPRKTLDKSFCNVYTPPHLRNQRSQVVSPTEQQAQQLKHSADPVPSDFSVPNSISAIPYYSDYSNTDIGVNFYIGDYYTNGQLGLYTPNAYYNYDNHIANEGSEFDNRLTDYNTSLSPVGLEWMNESNDISMELQDPSKSSDIIDVNYSLQYVEKDEDAEKRELKRASQEINRSSKRIIKQSFDSDVLVISDPLVDAKNEPEPVPEEVIPETVKPKVKLEPKVSLKREENDWDAVFDDSGECLDPSLLEELTATVGKVQISKPKNNYGQYQTKAQTLFNGPYDETFAHVIEVYDFPNEFKTNDLLSVFSEYKDTGFEIKWVDDTHALIVFSSAKIAAEVLSSERPLVRCRPLHAATLESRNKAKKCAEFLQPYRQRPETCTALARRLVSGALGVRLSTARQERAEERRLITLAREKKRQAALHKEAAWDGSLAGHSGPEQ